MKYIKFFLLLFISSTSFAQQTDTAKVYAREIIDLFVAGKYAAIDARCDSVMKRRAGPEELQRLWEGMLFQYDSLEEIEAPRAYYIREHYVTVTPLKFSKRRIGLQIAFNKRYEISGIF